MADNRNVFWIASYPKSGNTWVRFIVCNILKGRPVESSSEIEELTPDIHIWPLEKLPLGRRNLFLKTHFACTSDMPFYDRTRGAIYVVRHVGDVIVSNLAYLGVPKEHWGAMADQFIQLGGLAHWTRFGMGTWVENIRSWTDGRHPFPIHVVAYESLLKDPVEMIQEIANRIGHPVSPEEARRIANDTSFSNMRSMEHRERDNASDKLSFFAANAAADPRGKREFMRAGKAGQFTSLLDPQQKERIDDRFGPILERLRKRA